jgi:hypothetical protein
MLVQNVYVDYAKTAWIPFTKSRVVGDWRRAQNAMPWGESLNHFNLIFVRKRIRNHQPWTFASGVDCFNAKTRAAFGALIVPQRR